MLAAPKVVEGVTKANSYQESGHSSVQVESSREEGGGVEDQGVVDRGDGKPEVKEEKEGAGQTRSSPEVQ